MAIRGPLCIFRMGPDAVAGTAHEDTQTVTMRRRHVEKVEFGKGSGPPDGAAIPAGYAALEPVIRKFSVGPQRRDVENPAPLLDESRRPDISYGGAEYNLTINFPIGSSRYSDMSATLRRLMKWEQESSQIKGKFPWGRYGVRNDAMPFADCEPDDSAGYMLSMVRVDWDLAFDSYVPVTIVLKHAGDAARLDTGYYRTSTDGQAPAWNRRAAEKGTRP